MIYTLEEIKLRSHKEELKSKLELISDLMLTVRCELEDTVRCNDKIIDWNKMMEIKQLIHTISDFVNDEVVKYR